MGGSEVEGMETAVTGRESLGVSLSIYRDLSSKRYGPSSCIALSGLAVEIGGREGHFNSRALQRGQLPMASSCI